MVVKNPPANAGDRRDLGSIPGSGRSSRGGNGNLLQDSSLEKPMDRGAWWATVSVQFSSVAQSGSVFGDSMDCSMPGLPVHHQFPELLKLNVCQVGDAIQPSHPLSSPSTTDFNLSNNQGLFQWVGSAVYSESSCNESVSCKESDITKGLTLSLSLTLLGLLEQQ